MLARRSFNFSGSACVMLKFDLASFPATFHGLVIYATTRWSVIDFIFLEESTEVRVMLSTQGGGLSLLLPLLLLL